MDVIETVHIPCDTAWRIVAFSTVNPVDGSQTLRMSFWPIMTRIAISFPGQQKYPERSAQYNA